MEIYKLNDSQKPDEHVDVKVDGLMLKVWMNPERCTCELSLGLMHGMSSLVFLTISSSPPHAYCV